MGSAVILHNEIMGLFETMDCEDLWHVSLSIRSSVCPRCGGTWKNEDKDGQSLEGAGIFFLILSALTGSCG